MRHALVDDTRYMCKWNIDYVRAQQRVLQFGHLELKADRGENAGNFFLCDADISLSNLNGTVIKNLVEKYQAFSAMFAFVIDVSAECLAERMS